MERNYRMIFGYIIGGLFALILIPSFIIFFGRLLDQIFLIYLFDNKYIQFCLIILFCILGFVFAFWSLYVQNKIGKGGPVEGFNIEISPKTQRLVVEGPYKYCRNPMILGSFCLYTSVAIYKNTVSAFISLVIVFLVFIFVVIKSEEKRLVKDFGNEYLEYRKNVSMLIPWFKKKN